MRILILIFALVLIQTFYVMAIPQIDEDSIKDEKKFLVDNGQCLAYAKSGGGGSDFAKDVAIGATVGAGSSVAFGAMAGGDIGTGAAIGAVVGGLAGGGRSVYRSDQVNDQIYTNCMIERGYKIWTRD